MNRINSTKFIRMFITVFAFCIIFSACSQQEVQEFKDYVKDWQETTSAQKTEIVAPPSTRGFKFMGIGEFKTDTDYEIKFGITEIKIIDDKEVNDWIGDDCDCHISAKLSGVNKYNGKDEGWNNPFSVFLGDVSKEYSADDGDIINFNQAEAFRFRFYENDKGLLVPSIQSIKLQVLIYDEDNFSNEQLGTVSVLIEYKNGRYVCADRPTEKDDTNRPVWKVWEPGNSPDFWIKFFIDINK